MISSMSTVDKKKALSSPKYSMQEHHDEMTDNNNRDTKNISEISIEKVFERRSPGDSYLFSRFIQQMIGNMLILEMNNVNKNFFD